jgi:hypothetical protein
MIKTQVDRYVETVNFFNLEETLTLVQINYLLLFA